MWTFDSILLLHPETFNKREIQFCNLGKPINCSTTEQQMVPVRWHLSSEDVHDTSWIQIDSLLLIKARMTLLLSWKSKCKSLVTQGRGLIHCSNDVSETCFHFLTKVLHPVCGLNVCELGEDLVQADFELKQANQQTNTHRRPIALVEDITTNELHLDSGNRD